MRPCSVPEDSEEEVLGWREEERPLTELGVQAEEAEVERTYRTRQETTVLAYRSHGWKGRFREDTERLRCFA